MRKFCKIIIYTLDFHHSLMIIIDSKSLIFHGFGRNIHLRQKTNFGKNRIICRRSLSLNRHNLELWIKTRKE